MIGKLLLMYKLSYQLYKYHASLATKYLGIFFLPFFFFPLFIQQVYHV